MQNNIQNELIGALIGLARATDGNEHLITDSSTAVIVESLRASDPAHMEVMLTRVEEEKRKMVPNCFTCACPCGRTDPYDLNQLDNAEPQVRELKIQILSQIRNLAHSSMKDIEPLLYKALIVIGIEEFSADDLLRFLNEIQSSETGG